MAILAGPIFATEREWINLFYYCMPFEAINEPAVAHHNQAMPNYYSTQMFIESE